MHSLWILTSRVITQICISDQNYIEPYAHIGSMSHSWIWYCTMFAQGIVIGGNWTKGTQEIKLLSLQLPENLQLLSNKKLGEKQIIQIRSHSIPSLLQFLFFSNSLHRSSLNNSTVLILLLPTNTLFKNTEHPVIVFSPSRFWLNLGLWDILVLFI
jgi:hypothetical protein